jgi:TonB-dependent receptor-like protein/carboxypeptidase family protein
MASAQGTTGSLIGTVKDALGSPLSEATVSISSPALIGGSRTTGTGPDGSFSFAHLAPGAYTVRCSLPGFRTQELQGVEVALDRATKIFPRLEVGGFSESIIVTTDSPVVDVTRAGKSTVYSTEYLERAAVGSRGRSYQAVIGRVAGADGGSGDPRTFGSVDSENAYYIDGIDTTDPVTGTFGTNFNFDAIQEISFHAAGFAAEFGRATGGVVNIVTKSGGNQFSGSLDVRYNTSDFNENGDHFDRDANTTEFLKPAATLGGPIRQDRIWFFGSLGSITSKSTPTGSVLTRRLEGTDALTKITWQIDPSWQGVAKYSADPTEIANANAGLAVEPAAAAKQTQDHPLYQAEVSRVASTRLLFQLQGGLKRDRIDRFPQSGDLDTPGITDQVTGVSSQNYFNAQFSKRDRDELQASLTDFVAEAAGSHEVKLGAGRGNTRFLARNDLTGGAFYQDANGPIDRNAFLLFQEPLDFARFTGQLDSAFLQDAWRPVPPLTLQLGVRYDRVRFENDAHVHVSDQQAVQPRLGFAADLMGDAKTVLRGSYGIFMSPNGLTLPSYTRTHSAPVFLYRPCSAFFASAAACAAGGPFGPAGYLASDPLRRDPLGYFKSNEFGTTPAVIQPGLKPMTTTEYTVGIERQLFNRTSLELSYIHKQADHIFEDTCAENVPHPTADPGGANCPFFVVANLPAAKRDYRGALLTLNSNPSERLHLRASYVYSKSRGSIEYTQNAGADFDVFPTLFVNRYGYLSDDRRHRLRLDGYLRLPRDWSLGLQSDYSSPFPYSKYTPALGDREYLTPRGAFRGASSYNVNLEIRKGFVVGLVESELIGTTLNLLGREQVTGVCENVLGCAGSISWGEAAGFAQPRRYELGLRLSFR